MSARERMAARLGAVPLSGQGTPCIWCGATALACQLTFVDSGEMRWCCEDCRAVGGWVAHRGPK